MSTLTELSVYRKAVRIYNIIKLVAMFIVFDLNKAVMTLVLCIPTVFFAGAMPLRMYHKSVDLWDIAVSTDPLVEEAAQFTIGLLEIADELLLAGVYLLVVQGSMIIYVLRKMSSSVKIEKYLTPALNGLTSGTLKEKVSSTIMIASALFLFKLMLKLPTEEHIHWMLYMIVGSLHLLLIVGYFVVSICNNMHDRNHAHDPAPAGAGNHDDHDDQQVPVVTGSHDSTTVHLDKKEH